MPDVNLPEHHYGMAVMPERTQILGAFACGISKLNGTAVKLFFHTSPSARVSIRP